MATVAIRQRHIPPRGPTRAVALLARALLDRPAPWEKVWAEWWDWQCARMLEEGQGQSEERGESVPPPTTSPLPPSPAQDDLLDTLYWLRQILALFLGLAAGAGAHTGLVVFLAHLALSAVLPLAWARGQGVDDDLVGGAGPLMNEGIGPAVGLFTLCWILSYTQAIAAKAS